MSKRKKIILVICGIVVVFIALVALSVIPFILRSRANDTLAKEINEEFDEWYATIPEIPDSENGALVILKGLELLDEFPHNPEGPDGWCLEKEEDAAILREYIKRSEKAMEFVEKGLEYDKWEYPVNYKKGMSGDWHFEICNAARILILKGDFLQLEGRTSEAIETYIKALRLGSTLSSNWFLISRIEEITIYKMALTKIASVSSKESMREEQLASIIEKLCDIYEFRGDVIATIESDALMLISFIADGIGKGYSMLRTWERFYGSKEDYGFPPGKWWYNLESDVGACREFLEICGTVDPAQYHAMPEFLKDSKKLRERFESTFTKSKPGEMIMYPTLSDFVIRTSAFNLKRFAKDEAYWKGCITLASIQLFEKRNNRLPLYLEELIELVPRKFLVDPFSGEYLQYEWKYLANFLTDEYKPWSGNEFYLYSVGVDGINEMFDEAKGLPIIRFHAKEPDDIVFYEPRKK